MVCTTQMPFPFHDVARVHPCECGCIHEGVICSFPLSRHSCGRHNFYQSGQHAPTENVRYSCRHASPFHYGRRWNILARIVNRKNQAVSIQSASSDVWGKIGIGMVGARILH